MIEGIQRRSKEATAMVGFEVAFVAKVAKPFDLRKSKFDRTYAVVHADVAQGRDHANAWTKITIFDDLATQIAATVAPGDYLAITGKMLLERWRDGSGEWKSGLTVLGDSCLRLGLSPETRANFLARVAA